jgi:hypothetical protein
VTGLLAAISPTLKLDKAQIKLEGNFHGFLGRIVAGEGSFLDSMEESLTLTLSQAQISSDTFKAKNLTAIVNFNSVMPLSTKINQRLTFDELDTKKAVLKDGRVYFALSEDGTLTVSSADFNALGGAITLRNIKYLSKNDLTKGVEFEGTVDSLNLQELTRMADIGSFQATGVLSGTGVFAVDQNGLAIYKANFKTVHPGAIQYQAPSEGLKGEEKLAFEVLKDFRYTTLDIHLNGQRGAQNELMAQIFLKGKNPNVLNGYPFEFNIETTGQLGDLIRTTLSTLSAPSNFKDIQKMVKQK